MPDKKLPPIVTEAARHLVIPMARTGQATLRVDGHQLRIRKCPRCSLNTTFPVCPLCEMETTTGTPDEASLNRDAAPVSLTRGRRPERLPSSPVQCPRCKRGSLEVVGSTESVDRCNQCDYTEQACPNCGVQATSIHAGTVRCNGCDGVRTMIMGGVAK